MRYAAFSSTAWCCIVLSLGESAMTAESVTAIVSSLVAFVPVALTIRRHERLRGIAIKMQFIEIAIAVAAAVVVLLVGEFVSRTLFAA
jgi:hypothetical protein